MKNTLILISCIVTLMACNPVHQKTENVSTIDSTLQVKVDSILQDKLTELNALSGQAIVMEVQTGQVKAMVSFERKDSANYVPFEYQAQPSGLTSTVSILAALETGNVKMSDTVDVGEGVYIVNDLELKDHNWHRGGYGKITLKQVIGVSSNVGIYKTVEKAFDNEQAYIDMLKKMNYGASMDSIHGKTALACIGYNQTITPLQMLTFYNAIANNGKMVQPQLYQDSTIIINPQIASKANIDSMQVALRYVVAEALGKAAHSDKVAVSGKTGTIIVLEDESEGRINTEYVAEFCGFFPSDSPKYSIIVTINKMGLPVSGGLMAGDVFKQIVDYIYK